MNEKKSLSISVKSFILSMSIIILLMIAAYALTFVLPTGEYVRTTDVNGNLIIDTTENARGTFVEKNVDFPVYKFLLSWILILGSSGNVTLIMILVFLLVIGGIFQALMDCNLIEYLLDVMVHKFYHKRRILLALLPLLFMFLATTAGVFEEVIPLVPILSALAVSLGWDAFTGLAFSMIACACGYTAGVFNPFGTGVAQKVAGITVFSGVWMRLLVFVVLYVLLTGFLFLYTKKREEKEARNNKETQNKKAANANASNLPNPHVFERNPKTGRGLMAFGITIGTGILLIVSSIFITALQDYTLVIFALCFLIGGSLGCGLAGMKPREFFRSFGSGVVAMLPAILMILFASSIKYILTESGTIDSLVRFFITAADGIPRGALILFVYLIVLVLELFVPSGSAKAFLLIPLLLPLGTIYDLPVNLIVLAYIFGDGLANVVYPTNAGLLIALNLADTDYPSYMKKAWKILLPLFLVTCLLLLFALAVGYH